MTEGKSDSITVSKDMLYGLVIAGLAGLLVLSVLTGGFGLGGAGAQYPAQPSAPSAPTAPSGNGQPTAQPSGLQQLTVDNGALPAMGQSTATVTIVEFSDFQCPFCERFYSDAEAQIRSNYINNGKVQFYYRDFPLTSIHPNAMAGAIAGRCADDQGKFWEMHDMLFQNQATWSGMADPKATLEQYAASLGLDSATFNTCFESQNHKAEINSDESTGIQYGVQGTPGAFIKIPKGKIDLATLQTAVATNGFSIYDGGSDYVVFVPGAYPYSAFDAVLSKVSY